MQGQLVEQPHISEARQLLGMQTALARSSGEVSGNGTFRLIVMVRSSRCYVRLGYRNPLSRAHAILHNPLDSAHSFKPRARLTITAELTPASHRRPHHSSSLLINHSAAASLVKGTKSRWGGPLRQLKLSA